GLLISVAWMFSGIYYLGIIVFLLSFILFSVSLLNAFYNFIVDRRIDWKKLFVAFIVSVIGLGMGAGVSVLDFSRLTINPKAPSRVVADKEFVQYPMSDNLLLLNYGAISEDSFVIDNSLTDTVKIEVKYYKMFTDLVFSVAEVGEQREINVYNEVEKSINLRNIYKIFLDDLKNHTISNYTDLGGFEVKVYSSEENIEKLKSNFDKRYYTIENQPEIIEVSPTLSY
ncbi:MAG TPA: hypothetical protein PKL44_02485, partial [Candidatus Dojkabacteria bacterium]|nr:hypothetical protein [Candidatus Dojkabacteria bacterium]